MPLWVQLTSAHTAAAAMVVCTCWRRQNRMPLLFQFLQNRPYPEYCIIIRDTCRLQSVLSIRLVLLLMLCVCCVTCVLYS